MDRVFVADEGTGRRTFDVEGFSRNDLVLFSLSAILCIEDERRCAAVRLARPRDGAGGASPKMKNLMKAPRSSTIDSWPTRRP